MAQNSEETIDVTVRGIPVSVFERMKTEAQRHGVGMSNGDVLRWAAAQFLLRLDAEQTNEQPAGADQV